VFITEAEATVVLTEGNHKLLTSLKLMYVLLTQTEVVLMFTQVTAHKTAAAVVLKRTAGIYFSFRR
jgi:hypothetical protein